MVKKSAVIFGILAILALGAGMSWGYTVSKWPVPGIPGAVYCGGAAAMVTPDTVTLKGPVAPACEPPLIPGAIHVAMSIPYRALGLVAGPIFSQQLFPPEAPCKVELGEPAYVTAAVPCTPVNTYVPPRGW
jgi:hypothetical protein